VPANQASGDELFRQYKEQIYSEHVNRQFKGPLAVHPLFLHTPERIEALVFLLLLTLMLYFLLQRLYRQSVPDQAPVKEHRRHRRNRSCKRSANYTLLIHHTASAAKCSRPASPPANASYSNGSVSPPRPNSSAEFSPALRTKK